jgi:hypothetical protein
MAVVNLDKDIGYILAEGEPPVSPEKLQELSIRNVDRLNERYGSKVFVYMGSNSKHRVTVNITQKNESVTTAKMSFSSEVISNQPIKGHELPPFFTDAMYTSIWNELDKQLFILQSTTSN